MQGSFSIGGMNSLSPPRRLGLTGSIGAGKSTVAALLRERGLTVLDADEQARLLTQDPRILAQLKAAFPGTVSGGFLDRAALAAKAFASPAATARLNAIMHPQVRARMQTLTQEAVQRGERWIVEDIPLLFEGGLEKEMDAVLLVDAPLETRIERVMKRNGLSREDILARNQKQIPSSQKRQKATITLENDGDLSGLTQQVEAALKQLGVW